MKLKIFKSYQFLPKAEIERQANDLLACTQAQRKRPLKGSVVAEAVADFLEIGVVWENIPPDDEGNIAAMIFPLHREIVINENILALKGGFGQSTIAHEIGHWILHIDRSAVGKFVERLDGETDSIVESFLCRSAASQNNNNIEWQAQYFASCLLMPRSNLDYSPNPPNLLANEPRANRLFFG